MIMIYVHMILNVIWGIAISLLALGLIFGQMQNGKCGNSLKASIIVQIKKNDVRDCQSEHLAHFQKNVSLELLV